MKTAVIIGAGPAGLTAAYELLTKTDIKPIIIEADKQAGGLSKTIGLCRTHSAGGIAISKAGDPLQGAH